jgi:putative FmdB family regulatory protein
MPTYVYECSKCRKTFETVQSIKADALTDCQRPRCGGKGTVKRVISGGTGLIFKGSGFYITDYKNKGGNGKEQAESKTAEKSESAAPASSSKGGCGCGGGGCSH